MNNKGNLTLSVVLGIPGVALIILSLSGAIPWWWSLVGIGFLALAFKALK